MSRGRTAAIAAALIAIIVLCAACSSGSSKASTAAAKARAAAENRTAAAETRAAAAEERAASRLLASTPAKKQRKTTPTTTYVASTATTVPKVRTTAITSSGDLAAIERTVSALNAAFTASVASGITSSERANYWVGAGVYTSNECGAFETARGGGVVSESIVLHPDTLTPTPGWVDPVIGRVPQGRIYQVVIDEIQTLVTTGQHRERTFTIHVGVRPSGAGRLYLRCQ